MTNTEHKKPAIKRALVLSGGGGRGAYQAGVIKYLDKLGWFTVSRTGMQDLWLIHP